MTRGAGEKSSSSTLMAGYSNWIGKVTRRWLTAPAFAARFRPATCSTELLADAPGPAVAAQDRAPGAATRLARDRGGRALLARARPGDSSRPCLLRHRRCAGAGAAA